MAKRSTASRLHPAFPSMIESTFKLWSIAFTAPEVIAHRTARMMLAGPNPGARDRREQRRMVEEKVVASGESLAAMALPLWRMNQELAAVAMRQCWNFWSAAATATGTPQARARKLQSALARGVSASISNPKAGKALAQAVNRGLHPFERRVSANVKRLRRG